jgi:hypothetical protein
MRAVISMTRFSTFILHSQLSILNFHP